MYAYIWGKIFLAPLVVGATYHPVPHSKCSSRFVDWLSGLVVCCRAALLEFEALSGKVSLRRACVMSQAVSIAATSFCAKLEMMAR